MLKKWDDLPSFMRTVEVRPYWEILNKKRGILILKRISDIIIALILLIVFAIPMLIIAVCIRVDSQGPVLFRQERVTQYGKHFKIHKFRTMIHDADKTGTEVTIDNDSRITKVGMRLRNLRLDEFPQLLDVLEGNMSFVGTRPETAKYVEQYQPVYYATLLMPAGITSKASIKYKDEEKMLTLTDDVDKKYINEILPEKMKLNLQSIENISMFAEISVMFKTVFAVIKKNNGKVFSFNDSI